MKINKNSVLPAVSTELPNSLEAELNAKLIARLQAVDPEKWTEEIDQLAKFMQKKPRWARSNERIDEQVENIFFKLLKGIVFSD